LMHRGLLFYRASGQYANNGRDGVSAYLFPSSVWEPGSKLLKTTVSFTLAR
jgi:hypothetical protein